MQPEKEREKRENAVTFISDAGSVCGVFLYLGGVVTQNEMIDRGLPLLAAKDCEQEFYPVKKMSTGKKKKQLIFATVTFVQIIFFENKFSKSFQNLKYRKCADCAVLTLGITADAVRHTAVVMATVLQIIPTLIDTLGCA